MDQVTFSFAPNPGEPGRPLAKIASGGELSRVQLALAAALAEEEGRQLLKEKKRVARPARTPVRTFVFDEVDAGVSGAAAAAVGEKLRTLARDGQILVVTHLPQVAAAGDHHFAVEKESATGRTRTRVAQLDKEGRIEAIASLLAGASVGEKARDQARQLLLPARVRKGS
jgi:DNA repair protein RecN (Recombination protein N)